MKTNKLGNSDLSLGRLGAGCWAFGGGAYWGAQSQKDVDEVVHMALDHGINYFDTAEVYNEGRSEEALGQALLARRSQAVVGTKISTSNAAAERMIEHCDASLKRLRTDHIDLYMLHWPLNQLAAKHFTSDAKVLENLPTVQETFEGLHRLKMQGKIRHIGVSNHGIRQMQEIAATGIDIVANELPYNLISRAIEPEIAPYCMKNGVGIIGYMSMQQGILAGASRNIGDVRPAQAHSRHFKQERGGAESRHFEAGVEDEIFALLGEMRRMSADLGVETSVLSLSFALANEAVGCTLVGSRNTKQLRMNIRAADYELPADAYNELKRLTDPILLKLGNSPDYYENRARSRIF